MKITVNELKEPEVIYPKDLKPGMVFESETGKTCLKLERGEVLILVYDNGDEWLRLAEISKTAKVKKVLGKLVELVVE